MDKAIAWLDTVISATAWPMEPPKAYGWFHILFMFVGFSLITFAAWKLRKIGDKGNRIVMLTIGLFLAISELYKQLFYYFCLNDGHYNWGIFPFHLCSIPMYLCLIVTFLKPGKIQKAIYSFMMLYNLLSGAIAFLEPSGLHHPYWTLTVHALIWHMLIAFAGLYILLSGRGGHGIADYKAATCVFLKLCAIAFCTNLAFWNVSNGDINMFFVGPRNSSIIVFKQISESFGWYVSTALYIPSICLGGYLIFLPTYLYHRKKEKALP